MDSRVTSIVALGRVESGQSLQRLGPDSGSASGRTAVTKCDEGVAPTGRGASQIATPGSTGVAELTHDLVRGQLTEYLDDELGENDRRRVDGHLAICPPCSAYLHTLRTTVRELGKLPAPMAPTDAKRRIIEQARRESAANTQ
jgi:hypothetical protein